jgi:hypothetical protein
VPVPPPTEATARLTPADADEVRALMRAFVSATAPDGGLTPTQSCLLAAVAKAMTGHFPGFDVEPITPEEFAQVLAPRLPIFRTRIVQTMVLSALVLRPVPADVAARIAAFAAELGVDDDMLRLAREHGSSSLGLAAVDFDRNGYLAHWQEDTTAREALHTSHALTRGWEECVDDAVLAARWCGLEQLPPGTLGRRVADFYRARGFAYPGQPGSAPPLLAQHDWVHVLANFGTKVESELEVFAFIARANDDPRAFSLLAMVVSLFETGALDRGAGLFEASPGHLSEPGVAERLACAMRRGANAHTPTSTSVDFLGIDWFAMAEMPLRDAQEHFAIDPVSPEARASGSVGPWDPGGISPYQLECGRKLAATRGYEYDSFGATV